MLAAVLIESGGKGERCGMGIGAGRQRVINGEGGMDVRPIYEPVTRIDLQQKTAGEAKYEADVPREGVLHAVLVRAQKANAALCGVEYPPLPDGYFAADARDMPVNRVHITDDTMPAFAQERVYYVGEPVAIIAGPDAAVAAELARRTAVRYGDERPAVTDARATQEFFHDFHIGKGDPDAAFAAADFVMEEEFATGLQEQMYLEPQVMTAWVEDGVLCAAGSLQCPYYVHEALRKAFALDGAQVRVRQTMTGGAFGGKEDFPSIMACQAAALARKCRRPVRLAFERGEDIRFTTKRHPSYIRLRSAVKAGRVTALEADIILDAGAYTSLSMVVLQRSMFCCTGVYNIENLRCRGRTARTNTPPNGAFRGFGGPQSFYAIESHMSHLAKRLGVEEAAFKRAHFARRGDGTATGGEYFEPPPCEAMLARALEISGYAQKRKAFSGQTGRMRRGIGFSVFFHGCGFTGNGERDYIKSVVRLEKDEEDRVHVRTANTEMGQGVLTAFCKIAASALEIPLEQVDYELPDTALCPNSGPTVASRSVLIPGQLVARAARRLKENWQSGVYQLVEEHYQDPPHRKPFSDDFVGDAYIAYSWGVNVVEVEVDTLMMQARPVAAWGVFDCGTPIDRTILRGQAEGGMLQAIAQALCEVMDVDAQGCVRQQAMSDYMIPTSADAPQMQVEFYEDPYYDGPFGARGAGELMTVGGAPAAALAVENALGIAVHQIPASPEQLLAEVKRHGNAL